MEGFCTIRVEKQQTRMRFGLAIRLIDYGRVAESTLGPFLIQIGNFIDLPGTLAVKAAA